jgi:hypothetical protein
VHFDIGKQKVVWILKCRKHDREAAGNTSPAKHPTHSPRSQQSFQKFWPITTMIFNPIFRFSSLLIQTEEKSESKQKKKEGLKREKKKTEVTDAVWEAFDKATDCTETSGAIWE